MVLTIINQVWWFHKVPVVICVIRGVLFFLSDMAIPTLHAREIDQVSILFQYTAFLIEVIAFIMTRSAIPRRQTTPFSWPCRNPSRSPAELGQRLLKQFTGIFNLFIVSILWVRIPGEALGDTWEFFLYEILEGRDIFSSTLCLAIITFLLLFWALPLLLAWYIAIVTSVQDWMEVGAMDEPRQRSEVIAEVVQLMRLIHEPTLLMMQDMRIRVRKIEARLRRLERESKKQQ